MSANQLQHVNFSDIRLGQNVRYGDLDEYDVTDLIASLPIVGLLEPLIVSTNGDDGHVILIAGFRRYQAMRVLEWAQPVPVMLLEEMPEEQRLEIQLTENLMRKELEVSELTDAFVALLATKKRKIADLAVAFNVSQARIAQLCSLVRLPDKWRQWIDDGKVNIGDAYEVCRLSAEDVVALLDKLEGQYTHWEPDHILEYAARRAKEIRAERAREKERAKQLAALQAQGLEVVEVPDGYRYWQVVELDDVDARTALVAEVEADEDILEWCWSLGLRDVGQNSISMYVKMRPTEPQSNDAAERRAAEQAKHKADAADQRRRDREKTRLRDQACQQMLAKPPMAALKSALLTDYLDRSSPISRKRGCEIMGLEPVLNKEGKKDWEATWYAAERKAKEEGNEKRLAQMVMTIAVVNDGSRHIQAAMESAGFPTSADLVAAVNAKESS